MSDKTVTTKELSLMLGVSIQTVITMFRDIKIRKSDQHNRYLRFRLEDVAAKISEWSGTTIHADEICQLVTRKQVLAILEKHGKFRTVSCIHLWDKKGVGPAAFILGGSRRYRASDVEAWAKHLEDKLPGSYAMKSLPKKIDPDAAPPPRSRTGLRFRDEYEIEEDYDDLSDLFGPNGAFSV